MKKILHIACLLITWVLLTAGVIGTVRSGHLACVMTALAVTVVLLLIDMALARNPKSIAFWTTLCAVALVGEFYIGMWATQTEKDPDLQPTIQFAPEDYPKIAGRIRPEDLEAHIQALSSIPSRLTGTEGCDRAADYIIEHFRALGVGEPHVQEFPVTVPVTTRAAILSQAGEFPIHPLFPNGVCPAALPEEGLKTRLVYAGFGRLRDANGKDIDGATVVVETGAREDWLYLIDLGAHAIIFVERERPARAMEVFTQTRSHQNVPRFWMTRDEAAPLLAELKQRDVEATLHSDAHWEPRTGKNIWVEIPGVSDAPHNDLEQGGDEVVVLEAYYDSSSFVPDLAPGAEQACGMAALLELAKVIKEFPFEKRVRLLATSGHFQALEGIRQYVWSEVGQHASPMRDVSPQGHAALFALDLSSSSERMGLFYGGHYFQQLSNNLKPRVSDLGLRATHYAAGSEKHGITGIAEVLGWNPEVAFVDTINPTIGKEWQTYIPTGMAIDHEAALLAGIPALAFVTTNDTRFYAATPNDTDVQIDNLVRQTQLLACLLPNAFNVEGRYLKRSLPRSICRITGRVVSFDPREGYLPDKAVPNAIVVARRWGDWMPFFGGVSTHTFTTTDENGVFELVGMGTNEEVPGHMCTLAFEPFVLDGGRIVMAPDFGQLGKESYPLTLMPVQKQMELVCVAFDCHTLEIYNLIDPRNHNLLVSLGVLEAGSNSQPPVFGTTFVEGWQSFFAPTATIYAQPGTRLKVTASAGPLEKRLAFLNVTDESGEGERFNTGEGFNVDDTPAIRRTYLQSATDMWRLNESRVSFFRSNGIENARVNNLHSAARVALDDAVAALGEKDYETYFSQAGRAISLESRAYPDVVGMANDTVRGVVFYLALLLPFAFTMERLFLACRRIETRILGIAAFFLGMFFLLRLSHPAFQIVVSPMVVLLGFVVAVLSSVIIIIVMGKLETLVSKRKVEQLGEHESGVQAISGFTLALEMGIANMRRRKARTVLTSVTLVILTFSVLSFASVTAQLRMQRYEYDEGATPYKGVLLRTKQWAPFPFETYASLRSELQSSCTLAPRRWYYGHLSLNQSAIDVLMGDTLQVLRAMIGVTAQEVQFTDIDSALIGESRWLSKPRIGEEPPEEILLPVNLATAFVNAEYEQDRLLRIAEPLMDAELEFLGGTGRIVGFFDPARMAELTENSGETYRLYKGEDGVESGISDFQDSLEHMAVMTRERVETLEPGLPLEAGAGIAAQALSGVAGGGPRGLQMLQDALVGPSALPSGPDEVLLPLNVAVALSDERLVNEMLGDKVAVLGRQFEIVGVFDWARMNKLVDIDGEGLAPVDPVEMEKKRMEEGVPDPEEVQRYVHHSFRDVGITSERVLGNLGGDVRSLAILPNDPGELKPLVEDLVRRMDYILFANLDGQSMLLSSRNATRIAEIWKLIILMLIAGLIVFNTMLGSVYERTKEIGTYTALGIAPSHIGHLFLVEAGVFAIIGVMAGYVVGQTASRLVHMVDLPMLSALNLNYSSLAGVGACILVMAMVLLSSIYPSRKASELGVPDIERRWKLPPTKEASIVLSLPFTVSLREAQGLAAFLKEYLDSHVDVSVGNFYVENVKAGPDVAGGNGTGVTAQFWLTPFDLGVSQHTTFILRHLEDMGACGVEVAIERLSGDAGSWRRANTHFMTDMRTQFLIWRNLSPKVRAEYVERGREFAPRECVVALERTLSSSPQEGEAPA